MRSSARAAGRSLLGGGNPQIRVAGSAAFRIGVKPDVLIGGFTRTLGPGLSA